MVMTHTHTLRSPTERPMRHKFYNVICQIHIIWFLQFLNDWDALFCSISAMQPKFTQLKFRRISTLHLPIPLLLLWMLPQMHPLLRPWQWTSPIRRRLSMQLQSPCHTTPLQRLQPERPLLPMPLLFQQLFLLYPKLERMLPAASMFPTSSAWSWAWRHAWAEQHEPCLKTKHKHKEIRRTHSS